MNQTLPYAGRLERLFANLIDTLILFIPAAVIYSLTATTNAEGELEPASASMLIVFLVHMAYYTTFTSGPWQATPGKRLLNMHVIRIDRQKLTQRDALERFLAYVLPSLPMYASFLPQSIAAGGTIWLSIFWFVPILTHPQRMAVHDKICRTLVVSGKPKP